MVKKGNNEQEVESVQYNFENVRKWFFKRNGEVRVNLFEKKFLFLTLNYPYNEHWEFMYADMEKLKITFYDSFKNYIENKNKIELMEIFLRFLKDLYISIYSNNQENTDDFTKKWRSFEAITRRNSNGWTLAISADDPTQKNGYDCGVFNCMKIEVLSEKLSITEIVQTDINNYRLLMAFNLLRGIFHFFSN